MKRMGRLLLVAGLFLFLAAGCSPKDVSRTAGMPDGTKGSMGAFPGEKASGELYALQDGVLTPLSDAAFVAQSKDCQYVLLGEGHNVACDHLVQARLLRLLASGDRDWVLGLEMLSADLEPELQGLNRDPKAAAADLGALERTVRWKDVWGYPFALYAPALEAALKAGMPLVPLNVPRQVVMAFRTKGNKGLSKKQRAWLPDAIVPPLDAQKESLAQIFSMHQDMMGGAASDAKKQKQRLEQFFMVQSLWDSAMAQRAAMARQTFGRPVAILAGSGHVENGWGIVYRLQQYDPGAKVLLVMPWRGGDAPAPELGDVFFHCPESHKSRLGMTLVWDKGAGRVVVQEVAAGSIAARMDLRPGDAIVEAGGAPVESLGDLHLAGAKAGKQGKDLPLVILRNGYRLGFSLSLKKDQ